MAILKRRWEASDRDPVWVFHYRGESVTQVLTKSWRAAREAVGLPTTGFHTMRHCGQSWLAQQGVDAEWRARLGGWSVRGMGAPKQYAKRRSLPKALRSLCARSTQFRHRPPA
jgi:integrase